MSDPLTGVAATIRTVLADGPPSVQARRWLDLTDAQLEQLWMHVGYDVDLAVAALKMRPSPSWLAAVLAPPGD